MDSGAGSAGTAVVGGGNGVAIAVGVSTTDGVTDGGNGVPRGTCGEPTLAVT